MTKMTDYVSKYTNYVKGLNNQNQITRVFDQTKPFYAEKKTAKRNTKNSKAKPAAEKEKRGKVNERTVTGSEEPV